MGRGVQRPKKLVYLTINLQFWAFWIILIFFLVKIFLMRVGGWIRRGARAAILPPPPPPPRDEERGLRFVGGSVRRHLTIVDLAMVTPRWHGLCGCFNSSLL